MPQASGVSEDVDIQSVGASARAEASGLHLRFGGC